jgi:hypothetical protein
MLLGVFFDVTNPKKVGDRPLRRKRGTRSPRADRTARKVQKRSSTVSAGQTDAHCDREQARGNPGEFEPSIGAIW